MICVRMLFAGRSCVVQRVAVCCSVLHRVAVCCSVLQYAAVYLKCDDMFRLKYVDAGLPFPFVVVCCSVLQYGAVRCSILRHT